MHIESMIVGEIRFFCESGHRFSLTFLERDGLNIRFKRLPNRLVEDGELPTAIELKR